MIGETQIILQKCDSYIEECKKEENYLLHLKTSLQTFYNSLLDGINEHFTYLNKQINSLNETKNILIELIQNLNNGDKPGDIKNIEERTKYFNTSERNICALKLSKPLTEEVFQTFIRFSTLSKILTKPWVEELLNNCNGNITTTSRGSELQTSAGNYNLQGLLAPPHTPPGINNALLHLPSKCSECMNVHPLFQNIYIPCGCIFCKNCLMGMLSQGGKQLLITLFDLKDNIQGASHIGSTQPVCRKHSIPIPVGILDKYINGFRDKWGIATYVKYLKVKEEKRHPMYSIYCKGCEGLVDRRGTLGVCAFKHRLCIACLRYFIYIYIYIIYIYIQYIYTISI